MWLYTMTPALPDQLSDQLRQAEPAAPPVTHTSLWLNLSTGALVTQATFGSPNGQDAGFWRVFHRAPGATKLFDVTYGFTRLARYELDFFAGQSESREMNLERSVSIHRSVEAWLRKHSTD